MNFNCYGNSNAFDFTKMSEIAKHLKNTVTCSVFSYDLTNIKCLQFKNKYYNLRQIKILNTASEEGFYLEPLLNPDSNDIWMENTIFKMRTMLSKRIPVKLRKPINVEINYEILDLNKEIISKSSSKELINFLAELSKYITHENVSRITKHIDTLLL